MIVVADPALHIPQQRLDIVLAPLVFQAVRHERGEDFIVVDRPDIETALRFPGSGFGIFFFFRHDLGHGCGYLLLSGVMPHSVMRHLLGVKRRK